MSHETFELIERLGRAGKPAAMATLVRTVGTTPRKEGTKMFVGEQGEIFGSVTIGGCVDARVIEESESVFGSAQPRVINFQLGDEDAWEIGLNCGGAVDVLMEPFSAEVLQMYDQAREEWKQGHRVALATVVGAVGSRAEALGSRLLIRSDGSVRGAIEGELREMLARKVPPLLSGASGSGTSSYQLSDGTSAEVYLELFRPAATVLIFGAGEVAMPLVGFAKALGFRTVVVDGRPRFANRDRFPTADEIEVGIPSEIAGRVRMGDSTAVVLVAHDYKYDLPVLKRALSSEAAYIGMLGSRRRGKAIRDLLRKEGVPDSLLDRIRVPIGLDLGGQSAAEIALSILAEIVAVMHGRAGAPLSEKPVPVIADEPVR